MNLDELIHHYSNLDIELISVKLVEILNEWKADENNKDENNKDTHHKVCISPIFY